LRLTAKEHLIASRRIGFTVILENTCTVYVAHEDIVPLVAAEFEEAKIGFLPMNAVRRNCVAEPHLAMVRLSVHVVKHS